MRNLKPIFAAAAVAVALVLPIAAWADDDDDDDTTITYETVHQENIEWLFPLNNAQCSGIPTKYGTITPDSSDLVAQTTTKTRDSGSKKIDVLVIATGTAVGAGGSVSGAYMWVYENHAVYDVPSGDGAATVKVRVTDSFRLFGNGLKREFSFDWRWRFDVPSASVFNPGLEFEGVAFPDDEEDPTNVSHFRAFSTKGNPLVCDPL